MHDFLYDNSSQAGFPSRGPKKGHKLQNEGYTEYSGEDYSITGARLNDNVKMSEDQRGHDNPSKELRGKGLVVRQPLS